MALENNIEQSVAKNWSVLFQNFRKVVTWMKSGLDSPEALAMPEDYAITKLFKAAKTHDASVAAIAKQVSMLTAQNTELQEGLSVANQKIAQLLLVRLALVDLRTYLHPCRIRTQVRLFSPRYVARCLLWCAQS